MEKPKKARYLRDLIPRIRRGFCRILQEAAGEGLGGGGLHVYVEELPSTCPFASRMAWCSLASSISLGGQSAGYSATLISPRSSWSSSICSRFFSPHRMSPMGGSSPGRRSSVQPSHVQLHLALVGGIEAAQLQLNGYQPAQAAVVEEQVQIEVEVPLSYGHALLLGDEGEVGARAPRGTSPAPGGWPPPGPSRCRCPRTPRKSRS